MTTATKAETLDDVLHDLAELAPKRFGLQGWYVSGYGHTPQAFLNDDWFIADPDHPQGRAVAQHACQEECQARGWTWELYADKTGGADSFFATIYRTRSAFNWVMHDGYGGTPVLAIATVLRDALRAEAP